MMKLKIKLVLIILLPFCNSADSNNVSHRVYACDPGRECFNGRHKLQCPRVNYFNGLLKNNKNKKLISTTT